MTREVSKEERVYASTMNDIDSVIDQESVNYRQAQRTGDEAEMQRSFMAITAMRAQRDTAERVATEHARSMQPAPPPQSNRFRMYDAQAEAMAARLSDRQLEAAEITGVSPKQYATNMAYRDWLAARGESREGLPTILPDPGQEKVRP